MEYPSSNPTTPNPRLARTMQKLLDRAVGEDPSVKNGVLSVDAPGRGFRWKGAGGLADPREGVEMLPDDRFRSASVGKMVLATTAMKLVEEGAFGLDEGIGHRLSPSVTDGLHVLGGRERGAEITPRQLLAHAGGLADYFSDGEPTPHGPPFVGLMMAEPDRLWRPEEILAWAKRNLKARFAPGGGWHYSDTGYLVAGLLIEAVTGKELHEVYGERIFGPLGMEHTHMTFREAQRPSIPGRPESRAYSGGLDYTGARSVSADWAGGGLTTTVEDLQRFVRAFADDRIFRDPSTRREMLGWRPTGEKGVYYGLGVRRFAPGELGMPGYGEVWGHTGALGSFALYWPEEEAVLAGTLNQSDVGGAWSEARPVPALVPEVLRAIRADRTEPA